MGCDIHLRTEKHVDGKWIAAEKMVKSRWGSEMVPERFYEGRNYDLFAILAGVRNGRGFAGIETGEGFNPISEPKGIPADASAEYLKDAEDYGSDGHSHSFLTLSELLRFDWTQTTTQYGVINGPQCEEWLRLKPRKPGPSSYSGSVSGLGIIHVPEEELIRLVQKVLALNLQPWQKTQERLNETLADTYARVHWTETYYQAAESFWQNTIPRLLHLAAEIGDGPDSDRVRIVFFFDN